MGPWSGGHDAATLLLCCSLLAPATYVAVLSQFRDMLDTSTALVAQLYARDYCTGRRWTSDSRPPEHCAFKNYGLRTPVYLSVVARRKASMDRLCQGSEESRSATRSASAI